MPYPVDRSATAAARRAKAAQRTRLRSVAGRWAAYFTPSAVQRLAELERETPPEPLTYTAPAVAALLEMSEPRVLAFVKSGALPAPDRVVGGEPRWLAATIDPFLVRLGKMTPTARRRAETDQARIDGGRKSMARLQARQAEERRGNATARSA